MKKQLLCVLSCGMVLVCAGCGGGSATLLKQSAEAEPLTYSEHSHMAETLAPLADAAEMFAASFAPAALSGQTGNAVVSPISVYLSLALAAECASGETAEELYTVLGVPKETVEAEFSAFYRSFLAEHKEGFKVTGRSSIGNSLWLGADIPAKQDCLDTLSEKYFCDSYSADFSGDNAGANRSIRNFVKENTGGLIDKDLRISEATLFTLINVLYLKDTWNLYGTLIPLTAGQFNGEPMNVMQAYYERGRAYEGENFRTFFAATQHGYKLHFLVPMEGVAVEDVFTERNLAALKTADYRPDDEENKIHYKTRCLFPAFSGSFDGDVTNALGKIGVTRLFRDPTLPGGCDLGGLTDSPVYCAEMRHAAILKVDRRGIEGSATVTMLGVGAGGPDGWETVYEDFPVDRSFGFVLTDKYGATLFSGIIRTV